MQATNTDLPKLCHHFYVVPEERMLEFDKFSEDIKKMDIDGCIRKRNEVIKLWINEEKIPTKSVIVGDTLYNVFSFSDMDKLCDFINHARAKYL